MTNITNFFKGTLAEMKQVNWPTRKKAVIYSLVVIIFSVAIGYLLGAFDALFRMILEATLY
jgi:preprotein translocase SecE subunit